MPTEIDLTFTREEYAARVEKVRAAMAARDLDLLIVCDPSNMYWLTGYNNWSFYVHQCVIVSHDKEPIWFGRFMDGNGAERTTYLANDSIIRYPERYVQSTECHPMDYLAEAVITPNGWQGKRIGLEMDNYYFSAAAYRALVDGLPQATFVDATALVNWQRAIKSEREIAYMRIAARIVERVHARIFEEVHSGMRLNELAALIQASSCEGADGHGGDYPAIVPLIATGVAASAPHRTWDDTPIADDAATFFEIAGCYKRYHCPQSRTIYLGKPPAYILDAEKAVVEGIEAGLAAARPGATCADVSDAFTAALGKRGIEKVGRCGYSIGCSYPPDWGERTMSLRGTDHTVLKPGMLFHFMPGIWKDDWGIEITEAILITEHGVETLCNTPRKLMIKE